MRIEKTFCMLVVKCPVHGEQVDVDPRKGSALQMTSERRQNSDVIRVVLHFQCRLCKRWHVIASADTAAEAVKDARTPGLSGWSDGWKRVAANAYTERNWPQVTAWQQPAVYFDGTVVDVVDAGPAAAVYDLVVRAGALPNEVAAPADNDIVAVHEGDLVDQPDNAAEF